MTDLLKKLLTALSLRRADSGDGQSLPNRQQPTQPDDCCECQTLPNRQQPTPGDDLGEGHRVPEPTATDSTWLMGPLPTRRWVPAAEHAAALLSFLQGPGGRTGTIPFSEMEVTYLEVCLEQDIEPIGWVAVGRELRRLLGAEKEYERVHGEQVRVYRIPPARLAAAVRKAAA